jgi:SPP1 gp7 family putative phage head morphogenesis protein
VREQVQNTVRLHRLLGLAARRRRQPRMLPPDLIEQEYGARILAYVARTRAAFEPLLAELPGLLADAARERERRDAGEGARIRALIEAARQRLSSAIGASELEQLAHEFSNRTSKWNREQLIKQTRAAFGIDVIGQDRKLGAIVEGFVAENVELIRNIPVKLADDIGSAALRAVTSGTLHGDLARELEERFGVARNRAQLIARDQVGKLNGQINVARQRELGCTRYIWRTVHDRRVRGAPGGAYPNARPSHSSRDGKVFSYDQPPEGGNPGEAILCRCYAEPVLSDIIEGF